MADERVAIEVSADTADAVRGFGRVAQASTGMAFAAVEAAGSLLTPFEQLELAIVALDSAITLAARGFELLGRASRRIVHEALELRQANDAVVRQFERIDLQVRRVIASFGEVIIQGLRTSGVLDEIEDGLKNLASAIVDADSAVGQFVRGGIRLLGEGVIFTVGGLTRLVQAFSLVADGAEVAQNVIAEVLGGTTIAAMLTVQANLTRNIDQLVEQIQRVDEAREAAGIGEGQEFVARVPGIGAVSSRVFDSMRQELTQLGDEYARNDALIQAWREAQEGASAATQESIDRFGEQALALEALVSGLEAGRDAFRRFLAAFDADADEPGTGRPESGSGRTGRRQFFGPTSLLFATAPGFESGVDLIRERGQIIADAVREALDFGKGPGTKGTFIEGRGGDKDNPIAALFDDTDTIIAGTLSSTLRNIGSFVTAADRQFANLAQAMQRNIAGAAASIGSAFTQAGVAALFSGGPFAAALGIGAFFSVVAGLLGGATAGASRGGGSVAPDVLGASRSVQEVTNQVVVQQSIGAVFAGRGAVEEVNRLRDLGIETGIAKRRGR